MSKPTLPCSRWRLLAASPVLFTLPLNAQTAPEKPKESDVVVMSPFRVPTSGDVGYEANRSLAGMGLNTKLTDLGASVSVVTAKFIEDTGSINLSDVLVYQTNMEVKGFGGLLSGVTPALGGVTGEPSLGNGEVGTRVRGLAEATMARNFNRSIIPMDGYNADRVEINRGANALLFGVGSPAGIINTSTAAAELHKRAGKVDTSFGSYGTWRASFDYNHVLLPDELAIRVAAVKNKEKFQQHFAYNHTDRKYVAGGWDIKGLRDRGLLTSTTLRASFEKGNINSNNPRVLTPSDRLSSWFDETLPQNLKTLGAKGKVTYDPTVGPFNVFNSALRNATLGVIESVNRSPTFFFQDVNATAPRDNVPRNAAGQTVLGRPLVSDFVLYPSTGLTGTAVGAYSREMSRVRLDYAFTDQAFYSAENLSDPSIFNFFDNVLAGPNQEGKSNLESVDVSLQQLLLKSTMGFEVSFNRQRWDESLQSLIPQSTPYISVDVNTKMWTGEPNPNFGRPFTSAAGSASYNEQKIETTRAKLFYELDLPQKLGNRIGGVLGKHVFSVLGQRERLRTESHNGGSVFYTPDNWANGTNQSRTTQGSKQIVTWIYLGPSLADRTNPKGVQLQGLQQNLMNFPSQVNAAGVVVSRLRAPSAAVAAQAIYNPTYSPLTVLREDQQVSHTASAARLDERTLDSQAFALQSNWLADHLVSTVGWRKEKSSIRGITAPLDPGGEAYSLIYDSTFRLSNPAIAPQDFSKSLFVWSAVAKAPEPWLRRVPVLSVLNAYYGTSENFNPPSGRTVNPFGREIAPPQGITKEAGIYTEAFRGRISVRVNFFETTQTGSFNSDVGGLAAVIVGRHTTVYNMVRAGNVANAGNGFPRNYVAPPQALLDLFKWTVQNGTVTSSDPGVRDTSDYVTKGKEIELLFRPARGLSFVMNVAEQESVRNNTGAATRKLIYETPTASGKPLATEWLQDWAYQIPLNVGAVGKEGDRSDQNILGASFQYGVLNRFNGAVSADGAVVQELRKWRANFVGKYEFPEGKLKGFGVGSGVRWLDKSAIGYPVATFRSDLTIVPAGAAAQPGDFRLPDVRHPYFGPSESRFDAWLSYQRKILKGKIDWKLQLNVRNLFTKNELVPAGINPDGAVAIWSIAEGRKYTLSSKFSF
ncbi:MAG: TonB-dependent receptor [Opitutus sp.]|nr:TonB-dependent receptor [Opitutus sp.]